MATVHMKYVLKQVRRQVKAAQRDEWSPVKPHTQAIMIRSRPGEGKTASIKALGRDMGCPVISVSLANHDPTDLKGLGFVGEITDANGNVVKVTEWSHPQHIIPTKAWIDEHAPRKGDKGGAVIILWDDIVTAPPMLQALVFDALNDWNIGPHKIDPRVVQVATGNRQSDRSYVNPMPSALINRMVQFDAEQEVTDWVDWFVGMGGDPLLAAYITRFKDGALRTEPVQDKPWASPRSWFNCFAYHDEIRKQEGLKRITYEPEIVMGFVGEEKGRHFMAYTKHQKVIDLVDDIPKGKLPWSKFGKLSEDEKYVLAMAAVQACDANAFLNWADEWEESKDIMAFAIGQFSRSKTQFRAQIMKAMPKLHKRYGNLIHGVIKSLQ